MAVTVQRAATVMYADGTTPVLPGDRVSLRFVLRRRPGEVIYVPGISPRRETYEHHGLTWVGVSLPNGWATGTIVLPETGTLKPGVRFLGRGSESPEAADAIRRIDAQEAEDAIREAETAEPSRDVPVAKPTPTDWLAGLVAIALYLGRFLLVAAVIGIGIRLLRRLL
jgi:hypothetical protein